MAGARLVRLDAVPGIRLKPFKDLPIDAGAGFLASFRRTDEGEQTMGRSFAAVFQVSGWF